MSGRKHEGRELTEKEKARNAKVAFTSETGRAAAKKAREHGPGPGGFTSETGSAAARRAAALDPEGNKEKSRKGGRAGATATIRSLGPEGIRARMQKMREAKARKK